MEKIIEDYAKNKKNNGLILIDMPTGSGKSYSAIKFIYESCMKIENKDKKYFFVTPLKKNLPCNDLLEFFKRDNNEDLYWEKVLLIDSNMECVISGLSDDVINSIPSEICNSDDFKKLSNNVTNIRKLRDKNNSDAEKEFLLRLESEFRETIEKKFREYITKILNKEFKTTDERLQAIRHDKSWQWVAKLYPAVFTKDKQVIFLSMDKFISKNSTLVEPSYWFYNSEIIKEAIVFIDEFDSTKSTVLNRIINDSLQQKIDYIELFKDIYNALKNEEFPEELTKPSKQSKSNRPLSNIITSMKIKSSMIYDKYFIKFKYKTDNDKVDSSTNFLFQDNSFYTIVNSTNSDSYITLFSDINQKVNRITSANEKPTDECCNIQTLLKEIQAFIKYFLNGVSMLALNYAQNESVRNKPNKINEEYSLESAIKSVLDLFMSKKEIINLLTFQIMFSPYWVTHKKQYLDIDLSFYETGFRLYLLEDDVNHDMQTYIMLLSFITTPEKIILSVCKKAKVVGISATSSVRSIIGNYDIDYFKNKLNDCYVDVSNEHKKRLLDTISSRQKGYSLVNIHTNIIEYNTLDTSDSWRRVINSDEDVDYIIGKIELSLKLSENSTNNGYVLERYFRIAMAFKEFVIHDDIYSFLCVLTKHPKDNDPYLDKNILFEIFDLIASENGMKNYDNQKTIVFLDGEGYESKKSNLIERLGNGEKIFAISVYQTIGAGQNLQYPVPDFLKEQMVKINDQKQGNYKDFDAIYLDKPTNLIVPLSKKMDSKDLAKFLYQMEYLQESSELSRHEVRQSIKKAIKMFANCRTFERSVSVYSKQSVMLYLSIVVIQAIGRICRTNIKNKNIYIYIDKNIADNIDTSVVEGRIFNPEFVHLINKINEVSNKKPDTISLENKASLVSCRANNYINTIIHYEWSYEKINYWKKLRNIVLSKPTLSDAEVSTNYDYQNFYIKLPSKGNHYYYDQKNDYSEVSISFTKDKNNRKEVSEQGTKLQELLSIDGVKDFFIEKNYALCFEPNDYIMCPPIWNNIYKGALGEVVGKFLVEKHFCVAVKDIEDIEIFELFDYEIEGTSIFIDFKNWHEGPTEERDVVLEKISKKSKKCGCKCVVIANITAENDWSICKYEINGIQVVCIPSLFIKNKNKFSINVKAFETLRNCIDEFKY